jgi:hypothetical protein
MQPTPLHPQNQVPHPQMRATVRSTALVYNCLEDNAKFGILTVRYAAICAAIPICLSVWSRVAAARTRHMPHAVIAECTQAWSDDCQGPARAVRLQHSSSHGAAPASRENVRHSRQPSSNQKRDNRPPALHSCSSAAWPDGVQYSRRDSGP